MLGLILVFAAGCTKPRAATVPADSSRRDRDGAGRRGGPAEPSPPATAPATRQSLAHLTVRVTGLRNHKGQLIFGVFTSADGFPNVEHANR